MRILICAVGSMGDVAPYTGLGAGLRAAGHDVTVAGYPESAEYVLARGLPFRPVPGSSRALYDSARGRRWQRRGTGPAGMARAHLLHLPHARALARGLAAAAAPGADLMLLSGSALLGHHVAEAHGIPSLGAFLQPVYPSRHLPPWTAGVTRSLGGWANRNLALGADIALALRYAGVTRDVRAELGLPPASTPAVRRAVQRRFQSACLGFSPSVVPRPDDWPDTARVAGYWWPERPAGWRPPERLASFLDAGPPPVYVGFGSVVHAGVAVEAVGAALRRAGVRGVVQAAGADRIAGDDILALTGPVPHDWLFPRTAAVVHHGAAGTTAASLRAGRPVIPVPIATDHPFWADRLVRLGVSAGALPPRRLTAERLARAVRTVLDEPRYAAAAGALAGRIGAEDGAGAAARIISGA
ncbi:glycosyltransferase [Jidongwangia harbinensis]|uniref:glycosyltransferase n=1 Tax=Jidongwangia harbinensis TaxID=2878561 RepID=UPI001CD9C615|nr:nucleotide disphospho-sugar-binding domain-containing protein [Jidongwangia harbinensis]MCA2215049.1 glycosyltransferase [Jidongwangia harbinensis]